MKTWSAAIWSGGSTVSTSVTELAMIVIVHGVAPGGMSEVGSIVQVVGPPVTTLVKGLMTYGVLPVSQLMVNQLERSETGSVNVTVSVTFAGWEVAPPAGNVERTAGAASTVKVKTWSAGIVSGGSAASRSETSAATTVAWQTSPPAKSTDGSSVNVDTLPITEPFVVSCVPEVAQTTRIQFPVGETGSLKLTVTVAFAATAVAPSAGIVDVTTGGASRSNRSVASPFMVSGGSTASTSVTWAAKIVTVQGLESGGMSATGSIVKLVGPPVTTAEAGVIVWRLVPLPQLQRNQSPVSVTGSSKSTVTETFAGTWVAPVGGTVPTRSGAPSTEKSKL